MVSKKARLYTIVLFLVMFLLFTGGIMGIIKRTIPGFENFSFNAIFSLQGEDPHIKIVVAYSIALAILEIISALLLLFGYIKQKIFGLYFTVTMISVSAIGSFIAILFGDFFAISSLLIRIAAIIILLSDDMKSKFIKSTK